MQGAAEARTVNEKSPATGQQPGRGQRDSVSNANRDNQVISGAPREGAVRLDQIEVDEALQARERLDEATITEYQRIASEALQDGRQWPFPAVEMIGGRLVDGAHRVAVAKRLGLREIPAVDRPGDRDDALRAAIGANANHGLRRSNADKRRAVHLAIEAFPDLSNREVAKLTKVSHTFVNQVRGGNVSTSVNEPSAENVRSKTASETSKLDTTRNEFASVLESLRPGDRMIQGASPEDDWTSIERHEEGFRVLRLIESETLQISVRDGQQVEMVLGATDPDYSVSAGIQPFVVVAA